MDSQAIINRALDGVFPNRAEERPEIEPHPEAVDKFFDAIRAYNQWTLYRRLERRETGHSSDTLRSIFNWDIGCAHMDPAKVTYQTRAPREWENFAQAKILTQWAQGDVHSTRYKSKHAPLGLSLFPTRLAAENQLKEFADRAKIIFRRAREYPKSANEHTYSYWALQISDAEIDQAVACLFKQVERCNEKSWKESDARAAKRRSPIALPKEAPAEQRAQVEAGVTTPAEAAPPPPVQVVMPIAPPPPPEVPAEPEAVVPLVPAPDPAWLIALREDADFTITETESKKKLHIASTEFPHLGFDIKKSATAEEAKRNRDELKTHVSCHRANEEHIKELCKPERGFCVEEAEGTRFLCHIEAGIRAELKGTPLEQATIIDTAEAQWFTYTHAPKVAVEPQVEAGTPPVPNGELPSGKANGTKNGNGRKHAEYDYRPWQPDPTDTFIIFDATTLKKLCVPSGQGARTFLDIVKATAKLPGVKVIIPDVIANWELQGRIPMYDDHGGFTGYETVNRAVNSIDHLRDTAGVMKGLFESAAHGRITRGHKLEVTDDGNNNIIIMRTPKDADLYREIRNIAAETSTRSAEKERFRNEVFGHNFGERAITAITQGADVPNPMMIVSDDMRYFNTDAPRSTRTGNPVGHCSTSHYLDAQFGSLENGEIAHMLHMKGDSTQAVPDAEKARNAILEHAQYHSRKPATMETRPETMETMFPHRTRCGLWRDEPERGEGEGMYGLIGRCVQTQREHAEAKKANGNGNGVGENGEHHAHSAEETPPPPTSNGWAGERVAVRPIVPDGVNQNRGNGWRLSQEGSGGE